MIYAPLVVLTVTPLKSDIKYDMNFLSKNYSSENPPAETRDKLKFYRYKKGLTQKDVSEFANIDYATYSSYENDERDYYNQKYMMPIAEILGVDISGLVDDYNMFLYNEPHLAIKKLRLSKDMTQYKFGKSVGLSKDAINKIERGKRRIFKGTWEKMFR